MTFGTQLVRHPDIPVDDGYGLTSLVDDINSHAYAPTTTASMVSRVHKFFAFYSLPAAGSGRPTTKDSTPRSRPWTG